MSGTQVAVDGFDKPSIVAEVEVGGTEIEVGRSDQTI